MIDIDVCISLFCLVLELRQRKHGDRMSRRGLTDDGMNIHMISLNTGIVAKTVEELPGQNRRQVYYRPRYVTQQF